MTVNEVIHLIDALSPEEQAQVIEHVHEIEDVAIPDSLKHAIKAADAGRFVDMEKALFETPPSRR